MTPGFISFALIRSVSYSFSTTAFADFQCFFFFFTFCKFVILY